jgi:hypothetical protein
MPPFTHTQRHAPCSPHTPHLTPYTPRPIVQSIRRQKLRLKRAERQKLIVIMVGLPARGKTFLCNKLMCYLNWWAGVGLGGRGARKVY